MFGPRITCPDCHEEFCPALPNPPTAASGAEDVRCPKCGNLFRVAPGGSDFTTWWEVVPDEEEGA